MTLKTTTAGNTNTGGGTRSNNGTSSTGGSGTSSNSSKTNVGAIAGGAVAGVAAVALGLLGAMMLRRHRQKKKGPQLPPNPMKLPLTDAGNLEEGTSSTPLELMDHNRVSGGGVYTAELPAGEVAREIYTRPENRRGK